MKKIVLILFLYAFLPSVFAAMTEEEKGQYWYKGPHLKLPHRSNRGISYAQAKKAAKLKIPVSRKAPVAEFVYGGRVKKSGSIDLHRVPVELKEEAMIARQTWVRFGLPLPKGGVFSTERIRIVDDKNREIPVQTAVTGFWEDQSIKWALIQFSTPMRAGENRRFFAEFGNRISAKKSSGLTWKDENDKITVNTGKIVAVINKKKFNLLESVSRNGVKLGGFSEKGAVIGDPVSGREFTISGGAPDRVMVSEQGSQRLTLRVSGKYRNGDQKFMDYVARISFYAGSEVVDIEFTHLNTVLQREFTDISRLDLEFIRAEDVGQWSAMMDDGKKLAVKKRIFQETDEFYSVDGGKRIKGRFGGSVLTGNLAAGMANAWERYPKAIRVNGKMLVFELLPQQPDTEFNRDLPYYLVYPFCDGMYRMKWGMSFTEKLRLDFSGSTAVKADLELPVVAVLPASWYDRSGVFPGLSTPGFELIDKRIIGSFDMRLKQQAAQREYGFFNFGDSFGEKGENWTNNEYDMAHGMFLTFLRTGDRRIFRYALEASRHQADVDICHAYPDPYYVGGNLNHGAGHTGRYKVWSFRYGYYQSAANGHTWTWGMTNAWQLAGDAVSMDAAYLSGDHIALAMAPNFKLGGNPQAPRECSWAIKAIGHMYQATGDPLYRKAMKTLAQKSTASAASFDNGVWSYLNPRLIKERNERTFGNVIFITAVGLKGLCEYYRMTGDESVKETIRKVAHQILKSFDPQEGCGFYYDIRKDGKKLNYSVVYMNLTIAPALAEAAVILQEESLFDVARRGLAAGLLRAPGFGGKFLGEYLTFLTDMLAIHRKFPKKYQLDFKDQSMLALVIRGDQVWNMRAPDPGVYRVRLLKDGKCTVTLERWLWPSRSMVKKANAGIRVTAPGGKVVHNEPFDSSQGAFERRITLDGKKGDEFEISVRDHGSGGWCIQPGPGFVHAGVAGKGFLSLTRCGMNRIFVEAPANTNTSVTFYGTHCGAFGYWLFDDQGKLLHSSYTWQPLLALRQGPQKSFVIRMPKKKQKQVYSIVFYAEFDAKIKLNNLKTFSGSRNFY